MTQKIATLVQLKLDTILFHGTMDDDAYLLTQIAKDACYTSKRAVEYKTNWWNTQLEEADGYDMEASRADSNDAKNVAANKAEAIFTRLDKIRDRFQNELDQLKMRHEADCQVFKKLTGQAFDATTRAPARKSVDRNALRKIA